jgi:hypothetical protein
MGGRKSPFLAPGASKVDFLVSTTGLSPADCRGARKGEFLLRADVEKGAVAST